MSQCNQIGPFSQSPYTYVPHNVRHYCHLTRNPRGQHPIDDGNNFTHIGDGHIRKYESRWYESPYGYTASARIQISWLSRSRSQANPHNRALHSSRSLFACAIRLHFGWTIRYRGCDGVHRIRCVLLADNGFCAIPIINMEDYMDFHLNKGLFAGTNIHTTLTFCTTNGLLVGSWEFSLTGDIYMERPFLFQILLIFVQIANRMKWYWKRWEKKSLKLLTLIKI